MTSALVQSTRSYVCASESADVAICVSHFGTPDRVTATGRIKSMGAELWDSA